MSSSFVFWLTFPKQEFRDPRDADDARYSLDGRDFDGRRIIVEFARGVPRGSREYLGRGPPPGSGRCFNCGIDGHWARDCKAGDWKNKCYRCGGRGHIERNCKNSPQKLKGGRSYSRSPVRSHSPRRGRSRGRRSYSRGRSSSRSRSPARRERSLDHDDRLRSPEPMSSPPLSKERKRNPTPDGGSSLQERGIPSPQNGELASPQDRANYDDSPRGESWSPASPDRDVSPSDAHGRRRSPSPRDNSSPVNDDYDDPLTPRGSESP
ncbi:hypothetical protein PTKIN_Ptkin06aG0031400 [Pterospermum kingtungense]